MDQIADITNFEFFLQYVENTSRKISMFMTYNDSISCNINRNYQIDFV